LYVVAAVAAAAVLVPLLARDGAPAHGDHHGSHTSDESWLAGWSHWALMVVAMMLPVVAPYARRVAFGSLWRRRHRAIAWFVLGYLAIWLGAGIALTGAVAAAAPGAASPVVPVLLIGAAAWQVSRPRRRILRRCGALPPHALRGWRADRDCTANGLRYGIRCGLVCGPAMAAMALSGSPLLMAGVTTLFLSERARGPNPHRRAGRPLEAWGLATCAVVILIA
jgi:predicted metal-binding membrane protein